MDYQFAGIAWDSPMDLVRRKLDSAGFRVVSKESSSFVARGRLLGRSAYAHAGFDEVGLTELAVALDVSLDEDVFSVFDDFAEGLARKYGDPEGNDVTTRQWGSAMIPGESSVLAFVDDESWESIHVVYSSPRRNDAIRDQIRCEQDARHQEIQDVF